MASRNPKNRLLVVWNTLLVKLFNLSCNISLELRFVWFLNPSINNLEARYSPGPQSQMRGRPSKQDPRENGGNYLQAAMTNGNVRDVTKRAHFKVKDKIPTVDDKLLQRRQHGYAPSSIFLIHADGFLGSGQASLKDYSTSIPHSD